MLTEKTRLTRLVALETARSTPWAHLRERKRMGEFLKSALIWLGMFVLVYLALLADPGWGEERIPFTGWDFDGTRIIGNDPRHTYQPPRERVFLGILSIDEAVDMALEVPLPVVPILTQEALLPKPKPELSIIQRCRREYPAFQEAWVGDGRFDSFSCRLGAWEPSPPAQGAVEEEASEPPSPPPAPPEKEYEMPVQRMMHSD